MKAYGGYVEVGGQLHIPAALPLEKNSRTHCVRECAGPSAVPEERMSSYTCRGSNPGPSRWYDCKYTVYATQSTIHVSIMKGKDQPVTCLCRHRGEVDLQL